MRLLAAPVAPLLVAAGVALFVAACAGPEQETAESPAMGAPTDSLSGAVSGHERMVAELAVIAAATERTSTFTGRGKAESLRETYAKFAGRFDPGRRVHIERSLGFHELRLGNIDRAVEHMETASSVVRDNPALFSKDERVRTLLDLAVAHLRWGEARNCVALHTSESCILPIRGSGVHQDKRGSERAIAVLTELLDEQPASLSARWLLNVAHMTVGTYPDAVPVEWLIEPGTFDSGQPFPRFADVAPERGLNRANLGGGVVIDDFDGDGRLDVIVADSDPTARLRSYAVGEDGRYVERGVEAGFEGLLGGFHVVQADYDNDGDTDLLVLRGAWQGHRGRHPNSLLQNDGAGHFEDVTFDAGLGEVHYPTQTAAWSDYDNDGDLDLYIGNEWCENFPAPGQLFRNRGDGTFTDVAAAAGVENKRCAKGVVWGDFDRDRLPDLYVSNYLGANRLYRNEGDGTFTDIAATAGVDGPFAGLSAWSFDYDNDGALDLLVGGYAASHIVEPHDDIPELEFVASAYLGLPAERSPHSRLFRGDGTGAFDDVTEAAGLGAAVLVSGGGFGDLDADGYLDVYLTRGYPGYEALVPNLMFRNREGEAFVDVTTAGGFGHLQKGHGTAFADLDGDGDEDVYVRTGGVFRGDGFGDALFDNPGIANRRIALDLRPEQTNSSAIGATIRAVVEPDDGGRREIYRTVGSSGSFGGNPLALTIGVGDAAEIVEIAAYWPVTGRLSVVRNVAADAAVIVLRESEGTPGRFEEGKWRRRSDSNR